MTDRMHGHILAILRGQPTILLPTRSEKSAPIYETYTHRFHTVVWADNEAGALAAVGRLLDESATASRPTGNVG